MAESLHEDLIKRFGPPLERIFDGVPHVYIKYGGGETHLYLDEERLSNTPVCGFYIAQGSEVPEARPGNQDSASFRNRWIVYVQSGNGKIKPPKDTNI